jgi:glycosyltransferase involved in cell wall biosynthesis
LKVAYHSPLPPERSGVAAYSALLLPALSERVDVEVVRRGDEAPRDAEVALYHVGNDPSAHGWIVDALRRRPGVVVLHEVALHELVAGLTLARGDRAGYLDAVERDGGRHGRLLALAALDGMIPPLWELRPHEFPLVRAILDHATAVVVHSREAEKLVRATAYDRPVTRVPLAAEAAERERLAPLALGRSRVVCSFGVLNRAKRIPQLIEAFGLMRRAHPDAVLALAGPGGEGLQLHARTERAGLELGRDVVSLGYVDTPRLGALLGAADVCVTLRWPTLGEASASALLALAHARPLVVSDAGWFAELPASAAVKVPVDEHEVRYLAAVLDRLLSDDALRARVAGGGRRYVEREHSVERAADGYVAALRAVVAIGRKTAV